MIYHPEAPATPADILHTALAMGHFAIDEARRQPAFGFLDDPNCLPYASVRTDETTWQLVQPTDQIHSLQVIARTALGQANGIRLPQLELRARRPGQECHQHFSFNTMHPGMPGSLQAVRAEGDATVLVSQLREGMGAATNAELLTILEAFTVNNPDAGYDHEQRLHLRTDKSHSLEVDHIRRQLPDTGHIGHLNYRQEATYQGKPCRVDISGATRGGESMRAAFTMHGRLVTKGLLEALSEQAMHSVGFATGVGIAESQLRGDPQARIELPGGGNYSTALQQGFLARARRET